MSSDETPHPTRSVPLRRRPAEVCPINWIQLIEIDDLNNALVWTVSARPPISNSDHPLSKPLGIVPSARTTTGMTVTFINYYNYYHYFFYFPWVFHTNINWSLSDNDSLQVFRIFLRILANLNNGVVWMVSIHPLIFYFFSPFPSFWSRFKRTIYDWYHSYHVPQLSLFSGKVRVLISLFSFFDIYSVVNRDGKVPFFFC